MLDLAYRDLVCIISASSDKLILDIDIDDNDLIIVMLKSLVSCHFTGLGKIQRKLLLIRLISV